MTALGLLEARNISVFFGLLAYFNSLIRYFNALAIPDYLNLINDSWFTYFWIIGVPHFTKTDITVQGYTIPKGTVLFANILKVMYILHYMFYKTQYHSQKREAFAVVKTAFSGFVLQPEGIWKK